MQAFAYTKGRLVSRTILKQLGRLYCSAKHFGSLETKDKTIIVLRGCAAQEPMCGPANHRNGWLLTQLTASARNRDDWHSDSLVSPVRSRCDAAVKTQHFS